MIESFCRCQIVVLLEKGKGNGRNGLWLLDLPVGSCDAIEVSIADALQQDGGQVQ